MVLHSPVLTQSSFARQHSFGTKEEARVENIEQVVKTKQRHFHFLTENAMLFSLYIGHKTNLGIDHFIFWWRHCAVEKDNSSFISTPEAELGNAPTMIYAPQSARLAFEKKTFSYERDQRWGIVDWLACMC